MYTVALVQNQSEMAHYGYADARPLIAEFGYEPVLYTADNISDLRQALSRFRFDALVLASNALNDKTIRSEMLGEEFRYIFHSWLVQGRGCLSLHQLRLATLPDRTLSLLPSPLNEVSCCARPLAEQSADGYLRIAPAADTHVTLLYPNRIDAEATRRNSLNFRSLPGLYWHYWDAVNFAVWDTLLTDPTGAEPRALVLAVKGSEPFRVVLSSLTLDWQHQRSLLENLLTYVVEGRHNTAILSDEHRTSLAFEYLLGTLRARKFPFRRYFLTSNMDPLKSHLSDKVHTALLMGPFVERDLLPHALSQVLLSNVVSGELKLLACEAQSHGTRSFSVAGRERYALRLLQSAELQIQSELRTGHIDGSFWSTAETLQILTSLSHCTATFESLVGETLTLADAHDRDGSYDEVFGVTCALLWMRAKYCGPESTKTLATAAWIRSKIYGYEDREQALAYTTFSDLGILGTGERDALARILSHLSIDRLSELDLIVYLRAALAIRSPDVLPSLIAALETKQRNGIWLDLATSATAATTLIDTLATLNSGVTSLERLKPQIERLIFQTIIAIQDDLQRSSSTSGTSYPWDGKASTTVKCLQAWLKFDDLIDLPVYELVESLARADAVSTQAKSGLTALSVLEDLKIENDKLRSERATAQSALRRAGAAATKGRAVILLTIVLGYCLVTLGIAALFKVGVIPALAALRFAFLDQWAIHLAIVGVLAAAVALPWRRWIEGEDART